MLRQEPGPLCVGLSELQAYLRIEAGEEGALLAGLLRAASGYCESFINQALLPRAFEQQLRADRTWTMVGIQPVRAVSSVARLSSGEELDTAAYRVDIDHDGRAFLHGLPRGELCLVNGVAGLGAEANDVPEPVRQGILRLAATMFANRDAMTGTLPPIVTALWRPYRRAGLCR